MYYRRKILLALLNSFGNKVEKLRLQKLLLLFSQEQEKPAFNFVPYKYGCFSFQANADLNTMTKYKLVCENGKSWELLTKKNFVKELRTNDRIVLSNLANKFAHAKTNELIKFTYTNYPYYAINSIIAKDILSKEEYNNVEKSRKVSTKKAIYTIGYEGISLEEYLQKLINNNIKILCDVRNYPRSMKFGFSKNQLKNACEGLGIIYHHLPDLGIVSQKRKKLNSQKDYDNLFNEYKKTTLKKNLSDQEFIHSLLEENNRVALTCFEKNIYQCHRTHLANSVAVIAGLEYPVVHI